jgi:hypothetical protein
MLMCEACAAALLGRTAMHQPAVDVYEGFGDNKQPGQHT